MNSDSLRESVLSWLEILDDSSYYELLGLLEIADDSAIQKAFHEFSTSFHPDRHRGESSAIREGVTAIYRRGAEAYGVLRDPKKRAAYDLALAQGQLRFNPGQTTTPNSKSQATALPGLCSTKAGRLHARQLERAISERDWELCEHLLRKTLLAEGDNQQLAEVGRNLIRIAQSSFPTE